MTSNRILLLGALSLIAAGCDLFQTVATCDARIAHAVEVEVIDARTGQWIARSATGFIRDGTFLDSLEIVASRGSAPMDTATTLGAGLGRVGTYEVHVAHAGYRSWSETGVRANAGSCSVETARRRALLEPL